MNQKSLRKFRELHDPMDEIIGKFLSLEERQPTEDDIIRAIDEKYRTIHLDILYLKRQGLQQEEIQKALGIGEISYLKAIKKLKTQGAWKEYGRK